VKPPASIESEEARRPTWEEIGRLCAASATDGVASPVGICEIEEIASPQDGQNRAVSGASAEHVGQRIKPENRIGNRKEVPARAVRARAGTSPAPAQTNGTYFFSAGMALERVFVDLPSMTAFHVCPSSEVSYLKV
jgi:hypothetical protein